MQQAGIGVGICRQMHNGNLSNKPQAAVETQIRHVVSTCLLGEIDSPFTSRSTLWHTSCVSQRLVNMRSNPLLLYTHD